MLEKYSSGDGDVPPTREPAPRWKLVRAAGLVTLAALALAFYMRQRSPDPDISPLSLDELARVNFHPGGIGVAVQLAIVPVALILLFSNTALFQRIFSHQAAPRDARRFFAGLALIQVLVVGYSLGFASLLNEPPELSVLVLVAPVAVAGGLLRGWREGLGLGLLSLLLNGTVAFARFLNHMAPELRFLLETEGLGAWSKMPWGDALLGHYVLNPIATSGLWMGILTGLCADMCGKRRCSPLIALTLGSGAALWAGAYRFVAGTFPAEYLFPRTVTLGLAMAVVALIVRGVQAGVAQRQAEAAKLALTQAELRALRAQINPHFLFNALNTIRYFVRTDAETARRLLLDLSEIFQRALESGEFVPLRDELGYVEAYLAIEQARFDQRLQVEWVKPPAGLLDHPVPTLILQPIVENAVLHGIAPQPQGGSVKIAIEREGEDLLLRVEDDGPGVSASRLATLLDPQEENNHTVGLRNVDRRLRTLYGEPYRLRIASQVGQGTRVLIRIPLSDTGATTEEG